MMKPSTRRAALGLGAAVIVALVAIAVLRPMNKPAQAASTKTPAATEFVASDLTTVQPRTIAQVLAINGNLQSTQWAVVKAKQSVDVLSIKVREGDEVKAGQLLAQLDTRTLQAQLAEKNSALDSAQAQYDLAQKTRKTNATLLEKHYISQNAFDATDSTYKANHAAVEAAAASEQAIQIALHDAHVTSPIDGIVAKRDARVGEKAAVDAPLFTIVNLDRMELQALVPAADAASLHPGLLAHVSVDGLPDQRFEARLDRISPATESGTRSIMIFLTVPNAQHLIKAGMFAAGTIELGSRPVSAALPSTSIQMEAGQPIVWTIENHKLVRHPVVLGKEDTLGGWTEIRSGVAAGVPVLAAKFDELKEGAPAQVRNDGSASPAAASSPKRLS